MFYQLFQSGVLHHLSLVLLAFSLNAACIAAQTCDFSISNPAPCPGESVTFNVVNPVAGHKYTFRFNPVLPVQNGTSVSVIFPYATSPATYTVTLLDSLNNAQVCTINHPVNVKASPDFMLGLVPQTDVSLTNGVIATCKGIPAGGLEIKIKNNTPAATSGQNASYVINWGDGTGNQTFTNATFGVVPHTYQNNGSYPITITVTHTNGCVRVFNYSFFSGSNPAVGLAILGNSVNLCPPETKLFPVSNISSNVPGTIYKLLINNQVVQTYTQSNLPDTLAYTFTATSCGQGSGAELNTFYVKIIAENPCGSSSAEVGPITVNRAPTAVIGMTMPPTLCPGAMITFSDQSTGAAAILGNGTSGFTCDDSTNPIWSISPTTGVQFNPNDLYNSTFPVKFLQAGTYTITLEVFNANNSCGSGMTTKTIVIAEPPDANALAEAQSTGDCAPKKIKFTNQSLNATQAPMWQVLLNGSPAPAANYHFEPPTNAQSAMPVIIFDVPGNYTVRLTITNPCGTDTWTYPVTVTGTPSLNVTPLSACEDTVLNITASQLTAQANGSTITAWDWNFGPNATPMQSNSQLPTGIIWTTPGIYTITVTATNGCGPATSTATVNILSKPVIAPLVEFTGSQNCVPAEVKFTQTSQNGVTYIRQVYKDNVLITPGPANPNAEYVNSNATSASATIRFKAYGAYKVIFSGTNNCGSGTQTWEHTFYQKPTAPIPAVGPFCNNALIDFNQTLLSGFNNGGDPSTTYQWQFNGGNPATSNQAYPGQVQWDMGGTYNVVVTATNSCGPTTTTLPVVINVQQTVNFDPLPTPVCFNSPPFNLHATPDFGTFSGPGITNPTLGTFNPAVAGPGTHNITYKQGITGCQSEGVISITVYPGDQLSIGGNLTLCRNAQPLSLTGTPTNGVWSGPGVVADQFFPAQANIGPNTIGFEVTNQFGCKTDTSRIITVVAVPGITGPDTIYTCDIPTPVNLTTLGGVSFTPITGSIKTWSGTGVNSSGLFTSPGIGVYSITVTNTVPPMCDSVKTIYVKVAAITKASAGNDTTLCLNQITYNLPAAPAGGKWRDMNGLLVSNPVSLVAGTQKYIYILSEGTPCESRDTIQLTVIGGNAVNAGNDRSICETATSLTLPALPPLYWSGPALTGNVIDIQVLAPGPYPYTLTNPNLPAACNNDVIIVNVAQQPSAAFTLSKDTACIGQTVTITPVSTNVQYEVNWGDGSPLTNALTHQYSLPGPFTVTLTVRTFSSNQLLCENTNTQSIWIVRPPDAFGFTMDIAEGCGPLTVNFTNNSIAEGGIYDWDFGNGEAFPGAQPGPIVFMEGIEDTTYTIRLRLITKCDTLMVTQTVLVHPKPKARFGFSYPLPCSGNSIALNITSVGNPDVNTLYTSQGHILPVKIGQLYYLQLFTDSLPRSVDIWLVTSNACGIDTFLQTVVVQPSNVAALINIPQDSTTICPGEKLVLKSQSTPGALLHWKDITTGETFVGDSITLNYNQAGEYYIVLYAEGCGYDSTLLKIRVRMPPAVTVQTDQIACPGIPLLIKVNSTAGTVTTLPDNFVSPLKNILHAFDLPSGNYPVTVVATDQYGCTNSASTTFFIGKKPVVEINPPQPACARSNLTLTASGNDINNVVWFVDNRTFNGTPVTLSIEQPGQFAVVAIAKSSDGCRDTATAIQYIIPTPTAAFTDSVLVRCSPAQVLYQNQSTTYTGLNWQFSDQTTAQTPTVLKNYQNSGWVEATLIVSNENICFDTLKKSLFLPQTPISAVEMIRHCTRDSGYTMVIGHDPGAGFDISLFGQDTSWINDYRITNLQPGSYDLEIISDELCEFDTTIIVPPISELFIKLPADTTLLLGEWLQMDVDYNQNNLDFQWAPTEFLDVSDQASATSTPEHDIRYILKVTNVLGCIKTDTIMIRVIRNYDSLIYVPNAFTPGNQNGINDRFGIRTLNKAVEELLYLNIYDLHGGLVFSAENCSPVDSRFDKGEWDGTFRGNKAEAGIYKIFFGIRYTDGHEWHDQSELLLIR